MINVTDEILVTGYFSKFFLAGIEEARLLFGDKGAEAARQHIISDLKMEGWRESDPFPRDEFDYVRMGLF